MQAEHRHGERAAGFDKVILLDSMTPGYIRDLSDEGAQVAFLRPVPVSSGQTVAMRVIPVHDETRAPFEVSFEVHWVGSDSVWFVMGGHTAGATLRDAALLRRLVRYYEGVPRK